MAIGDPYATLAELKTHLGIDDSTDDARLTSVLAAASRGVTKHCRRQFNKTTSASPRTFKPRHAALALVDDFHTTTDLVIKTGDDGTFPDTWTTADYQLEPLDGIQHGEPGWPFWRIRAVGSTLAFPVDERATLQVTAQWGWTAVPDPVREACLILAAETFKLKDAPFGVAGFGDFGAIRVRDNPMAASKLRSYCRDKVLVA